MSMQTFDAFERLRSLRSQHILSTRVVRKEARFRSFNGCAAIVVAVVLVGLGAALLAGRQVPIAVGVVLVVLGLALLPGLYMLQPNEGSVLTLFGKYRGTDRAEGLRWTNPFLSGKKISLRARNLNTAPLKVNDKRGNPVEIGAKDGSQRTQCGSR